MGCTHDLGQYIILLLPVAMALAVYGLRSRGTGGLALCCVLGLLPAVCYLPGSPLRFLWALWGAPPVLWVSLFGVTGVLAAGVRLGAFGARRRNWLLVAAYSAAVLACLAATFLRPGQWLYMRQEEMTWALGDREPRKAGRDGGAGPRFDGRHAPRVGLHAAMTAICWRSWPTTAGWGWR